MLEQQLKQNEILKSELQTNYERIKACQKNGVANQSDLDIIKVEQLNSVQREVELKNTINVYEVMLSAFTGIKIDENSSLVTPQVNLSFLNEIQIKRPELKLFEAQNQLYDSQVSLLNAGNLPRIGVFLQGGYGQPGLDMFKDGFSPFYIGGIRFSWNINGFYSLKNNINKLEVSKKNVDVMKETFMFNSGLKVNQQKSEIDKYQTIISNDDEIIKLRESIKKTATVKVENGTLTITDLVREINAENQARMLKSLHEIQLMMSIYNLKNTTNY